MSISPTKKTCLSPRSGLCGCRNETIAFVIAFGLMLAAAETCWAAQQMAGKPHMVLIPGGPFNMGITLEQNVRLTRRYRIDPAFVAPTVSRHVDVPAFWIDRYEVTNREYRTF